MSLKCKLGFHTWEGCKCSHCGKIREEQHAWNGCKCSICEIEQHDWLNDCERCFKYGKIRDGQHDIVNKICKICGKGETFTDTRDGNCYKVIKIGNQTWFAENLAYKAISGCWAYDNDHDNVAKYGYLYDWETAQKVCPYGWHLPNDAEWKQLTDYLGGAGVAGGKMKATTDWKYDEDGNATNASGFNALPAGLRNGFYDKFYYLSEHTCFWTGPPLGSSYPWARELIYNDGEIDCIRTYHAFGYSVRCVKD